MILILRIPKNNVFFISRKTVALLPEQDEEQVGGNLHVFQDIFKNDFFSSSQAWSFETNFNQNVAQRSLMRKLVETLKRGNSAIVAKNLDKTFARLNHYSFAQPTSSSSLYDHEVSLPIV